MQILYSINTEWDWSRTWSKFTWQPPN